MTIYRALDSGSIQVWFDLPGSLNYYPILNKNLTKPRLMASDWTRKMARIDHLYAHVQFHKCKSSVLDTISCLAGTNEPKFAGNRSFDNHHFDHKTGNQNRSRQQDRYRLHRHSCLMAG